jgi:hypothetical protein
VVREAAARRPASSTSRCTNSGTPRVRRFHRASKDLKRTQMFMRHKSITTTAVPYMHLDGHTSREVMKLATSAGKSSRQRKRRTKCRLSRGLEAPSGLEPLYEALQASA